MSRSLVFPRKKKKESFRWSNTTIQQHSNPKFQTFDFGFQTAISKVQNAHSFGGKNYKIVNTIIFENFLRGSWPFVYIYIARTGGKDLELFNKQVIYTSMRRILFVCVNCIIFILLEYIKIVHIVHTVRIY